MKKKLASLILLFICSITFSQITLTVNQQNVQCFGMANGSATITPSGVAPFTYSWSSVPTQTSGIANNLTAGQYTVFVTDANLNTSNISFIITEPSQLTTSIFISENCGPCTALLSSNAQGGTGPYIFLWNNSTIWQYQNSVCSGNYSLQVTDANGCVASQTVNVPATPALTLNLNYTDPTCSTICNGALSYTVTGSSSPLTYTVNGPGWQPLSYSNNVMNLCSGNYTAMASNTDGCFIWQNFSLTAPPNGAIQNLTVTANIYNESCLQSGDGAIDINLTGTNPGPFTYQWSNGSSTQDISNIVSGAYWVSVIDSNSNCVTLQDTISSIGTNCGTISGNVYSDNNSDCANNTGDNNLHSILVTVNPGNRLGYTNLNGDYVVNDLPFGSYSVTLADFIPTCTPTLNTTVSSGNPNSLNNTLSLDLSSVQPDVYCWAQSAGIVPGLMYHINYYLRNNNNLSGDGIFKVTLPPLFISNISSVSPTTYTLSGDTILWDFSNVTYSNILNFYINFLIPSNTPLGTIFSTQMYVQTTITDSNPSNNINFYNRMVTGSLDPNDKTVSPMGNGVNGEISASETDLTYLIRFQNTGTGPAINIIVKDTLSPNVDINTFEMLSSSHNYNIDILSGNVLRWKFNNIMLPDSGSNEPASKGYIQYRIKRNSNNTPGSQIKNTAYIYFDFNEPVITNTAINTIELITGVSSKLIDGNSFGVYPNPTEGMVNVKLNPDSYREKNDLGLLNIKITDIVGKEVMSEIYKEQIDMTHLQNGIYFLQLYKNDQLLATKKVVKQ